MPTVIQLRRDTAANWASNNPTLATGEIGLVTDTGQFKIGNGSTAWNSLSFPALNGTFDAIDMNSIAEPSTPSADHMYNFAGSVGGRVMPKFKGPSGIASALQPHLARNKIGLWLPPGNAVTLPGVLGYTALTAVGTATARNVAASNTFTRMRRLGYVSAATAGSLASIRVAVAQVTLGDGSGNGGFHKIIRFGISDVSLVSGARMFVGVSSSTAAPTNVEPSTLTNCFGIGHGASDTNMKLFYGGSSAQTPIDLGAGFPIDTNTTPYELAIFAPPNQNGVIKYEVTNLNTGAVATGTVNGSGGVILPANSTLLTYCLGYRTNNATAAAVGLDLMSDYVETDQ